MVGTISPMVHGKTALEKLTLISVFTVAHGLGGAAVGTVISLAGCVLIPHGILTDRSRGIIFGSSCVLLALREFQIIALKLPQFRKQVPISWRRLAVSGVFLYGCVLGFGLGTRIVGSAYYAVLIGVFLTGQVKDGVLAMTVFGVARAAPVCFLGGFRCERAASYTGSLADLQEVMILVNAVILTASGSLLLMEWMPMSM